jgi:hypothetical protein
MIEHVFLTAVLVGLAVAALGWVARLVGSRVLRRLRAVARVTQRIGVRFVQLVRRRMRVRQRARLVRDAARDGQVVAISSAGSNPTRVVSDGVRRVEGFYYRDPQKLRRDVESGRVPYRSAFCCGRPPRVGQRMNV